MFGHGGGLDSQMVGVWTNRLGLALDRSKKYAGGKNGKQKETKKINNSEVRGEVQCFFITKQGLLY